jgi:hypothetical protein
MPTTKVIETKEELVIDLSNRVESLNGIICKLSSRPKRLYTVDPWRLQYKGETTTIRGVPWYWCTKPHWSGGTEHNGMYCRHKTEDHDEWRRAIDAKRKEARKENPTIKVIKGPKESI